MHVCHVIAAAQIGGAEIALERTIKSTQLFGWSHSIINLCSANQMTRRMAATGATLIHLDWTRGSFPSLRDIVRLRASIRDIPATIRMGWMYHGCAALTCSRIGWPRQPGMLWAIRSGVSPHERRTTAFVRRALGYMSHLPDRVVFVSERSRRQHEDLGFRRGNTVCIPNGYDLERFRPDVLARATIRNELQLQSTNPVVAWIGRWHPDKSPQHAIAAFQHAAANMPDLHLLMVGSGCDPGGPAAALLSNSIGSRVRLLGRRDDIPAILAAADVLLLSSHSEAFPNVIAEAMACGVPCVSTDVGDVTEMVGDTGLVVPVDDVLAMASGLMSLLTEAGPARVVRSAAARQRIVDRYSLPTIAAQYDNLWRKVIATRRH